MNREEWSSRSCRADLGAGGIEVEVAVVALAGHAAGSWLCPAWPQLQSLLLLRESFF